MATPHVAGVVGLLAAHNSQATAEQIKAAIMDGVDQIASMDGRTVTGGRLNAYNSLQLIDSQDRQAPTVESIAPLGLSAPVDTITVVFSEEIDSAAVVGSNFLLRGDGSDGLFDTADDNVIAIDTAWLSQARSDRVTIALESMLPIDNYRLTVVGTGANPIRDAAGNALGGGADTIGLFQIADIDTGAEPNDALAQATDTHLVGTGTAVLSGYVGDGAFLTVNHE